MQSWCKKSIYFQFILFLPFLGLFLPTWQIQAADFDLSYSGRLTDDGGKPLAGPVNIQVLFYRSASDAKPVLASPLVFSNMPLDEGVFQLKISSNSKQSPVLSKSDFHKLFNGEDVWIEVEANSEKFPRQKYMYVPYALKIPVDNTSLTYNEEGQLTLAVGALPVGGKASAALTSSSSVDTSKFLTKDDLKTELANISVKGSNVGTGIDAQFITQGQLAEKVIPESIARDSEIVFKSPEDLVKALGDIFQPKGSYQSSSAGLESLSKELDEGGVLSDKRIPETIARSSQVTSLSEKLSSFQTADGALLDGAKVGSGINAANVTTGVLADAVVPATVVRGVDLFDAQGFVADAKIPSTIARREDLFESVLGFDTSVADLRLSEEVMPESMVKLSDLYTAEDIKDVLVDKEKSREDLKITENHISDQIVRLSDLFTEEDLENTFKVPAEVEEKRTELKIADERIPETIARAADVLAKSTTLNELASNGSLSGSHIGSGISASNISIGSLDGARLASGIDAGKITAGTLDGARIGSGVSASNVTAGVLPVAQVPALSMDKITTGTLAGSRVGSGVSASNVTAGVLPVAQVPDLNMSKITAGTLDGSRVGSGVSASNVTAGVLPVAQVPALSMDKITTGTLAGSRVGSGVSASNITAGVLPVAQVPDLSMDKITTGTLAGDRVGTGISANNITAGSIPDERISSNIVRSTDRRASVSGLSTNAISKMTPVYIRGTGLNNSANALIKIGDSTILNTTSARGLHLLILNATTHEPIPGVVGDFSNPQRYDTYSDNAVRTTLANRLKTITRDQIGILVSWDAHGVNDDLRAAARNLGLFKLANFPVSAQRMPYAAIFKGSDAVEGLQAKSNLSWEILASSDAATNHAVISTFLVDDGFVGQQSTNVLVSGDPNAANPVVSVNEAGNVGVGTTSPSTKLHVNGSMRVVDGTQAAGKVLVSDANGQASWDYRGVPSGAVMFFNLASCPSGWTELTAARGRVVVGLPASGTLAGTKGSALDNQAARTITEVPAHTHTHYDHFYYDYGSDGDCNGDGDGNKCGMGPYGTGSGDSSGGNKREMKTTNSTGSASVDVTMPYIQLLVCQKS